MRIKKIFCIAFVICLAVLPGACAKSTAYVLDIGGAQISQDVYTCLMDSVVQDPEEYGLSTPVDENAVKEKTLELCKDYVAVNTLFNDLGIPLGDNEKAAVSTTVNGLWHLFSVHYESIGITKQTLTKVETSKAAKDTLLLYYYDEQGPRAVSESEIKTYFSENYISFRSINGYLTKTDENGETVKLDAEETALLKSNLEGLAVRLNDGEDFEVLSEQFAASQGITAGLTDFRLLRTDDTSYPEGFFEQVAALEPGTPGIIATENYIFLVVTREILLSEEDLFNTRKECLKALRGAELDRMIETAAAEYETTVREKIIGKIYDKIASQYDDAL